MQPRAWIALLAVTVVAVAGAVYSSMERDATTAVRGAEEPLFPGLEGRINDVAGVTVKGAERTLTIRRAEGGGWVMAEKHDYPVSADKVKKAVVALARLRVLEAKTAKPELYAKIGVRDIGEEGSEAVLLGLEDASGQGLAALLVGKTRKAEAGAAPAEVYVRKPEAARAWLVEAHLDVKANPLAWLDREMLKLERKRVRRVVVTHPDGETVAVEQDAELPDIYNLQDIPEGRKVKTAYTIAAMAGGLVSLAYLDVAVAADKGFDEGATVSVLETSDGLRVTVSVKEDGEDRWLQIAAAFDEALAGEDADAEAVAKEADEINARHGGWAYKISTYDAENFTRRMADLTEKIEPDKDGDS
jgi:hypothetical protein